MPTATANLGKTLLTAALTLVGGQTVHANVSFAAVSPAPLAALPDCSPVTTCGAPGVGL